MFADGTPKPKAFEPEWHPTLARYETSVCGLNGVSEDRLWHLGRTVRASANLTAIAALEIPVPQITAADLRCEAAPEIDYDGHGVILGWAADRDAKDERLAAQQELVAAVSQVKRPGSTDA
ncbi:hypothetical protein [Trinickia mobilis]|uniref:hypothetical protein n=1 Tax=Trinickia mobilis TaxID=2816356 RepID=UPI001A9050AD|nr:hypothetical protein [Trinickia mobilis]